MSEVTVIQLTGLQTLGLMMCIASGSMLLGILIRRLYRRSKPGSFLRRAFDGEL